MPNHPNSTPRCLLESSRKGGAYFYLFIFYKLDLKCPRGVLYSVLLIHKELEQRLLKTFKTIQTHLQPSAFSWAVEAQEGVWVSLVLRNLLKSNHLWKMVHNSFCFLFLTKMKNNKWHLVASNMSTAMLNNFRKHKITNLHDHYIFHQHGSKIVE